MDFTELATVLRSGTYPQNQEWAQSQHTQDIRAQKAVDIHAALSTVP